MLGICFFNSRGEYTGETVCEGKKGVGHALQGIGSHSELLVHSKVGASWEGFALEQILRAHRGEAADLLVHRFGEWRFGPGVEKLTQFTRNKRHIRKIEIRPH